MSITPLSAFAAQKPSRTVTDMTSEKIGFLRRIRVWMLGTNEPTPVAWGVTLGLLIGLVPKDSVFTYLAGLAILAISANVICGFLSAVCFTVVGWLAEPLLHKLGAIVLTNESLLQVWAAVYQMPFAPWTRFNNTIVMGALVASAILAIPMFRISRNLAARIFPRATNYFGQIATPGWPSVSPTTTQAGI